MARQANASYEGNGQRQSLMAKQMEEKLTALANRVGTLETENKALKTKLEKCLPYQYGYGILSPNTNSDKGNYWYKLCTMRVTSRYGSCALRAVIYAEGDGQSYNATATIQARLKQQNEMGAEPYRSVLVFDTYGMTADSFRICITTNTSTLTIAEVWVRTTSTHRIHVNVLESLYGTVEVNTSMALQASPPSCTYYSSGTDVNGENTKSTLLKAYPVGAIYMSTQNVNPSSLFGGTWVAWGSGRVPVGVNTSDSNFNTVEKTGGASSHTHSNPTTGAASGSTGVASGNTGATTLTVSQIPAHAHNEYLRCCYPPTGSAPTANSMHVAINNWDWTDNAAGDRKKTVTGTMNVNTSNAGGGGSHTHSLNNHTHTLGNHTHTQGNTGNSSSLQPYITCYMWKRTA